MHPVQLNQKLIRLCARRNLTQEALGDSLGIAHTTVGRWLSGKSRPYPRIAQQLADHFGLPVEVITDDTKALPPPTDEDIEAASDKPLPPELAKPLAENLQKAASQLLEKSKGMPPGSTLGDMILIEEIELMLNHANGLVESLERLKERLTGTKEKGKKIVMVRAPAHHRNPVQPAMGGSKLKTG